MSGERGSQPISTAVQYTGAQINFGDPTPYLTYAVTRIMQLLSSYLSLSLYFLMEVNPMSTNDFFYQQGGEKSCGESRHVRPRVGPA